MEDVVGEFNKARLDVDLFRLDVYLANHLLARLENQGGRGNHHGVRLRERNSHLVYFPGDAEISGPSGVKLRRNILGRGVREPERARRYAAARKRGLGLRLGSRLLLHDLGTLLGRSRDAHLL